MKISEVTELNLIEYARESNDPEIFDTFTTILVACKAYIRNYTGLSNDQMDAKEDLTIALMVLANELYENRTFTVQDNKVNVVVKSILDMYSINLL
jgi:hypothetical protein